MITVPLLRSMPPKAALRFMLTGERIPVKEGEAIGFVTAVAGEGGLDALTEEYLAMLMKASPQAIKVGRSAFYRVLDSETSFQLEYLWAHLAVTLGSSDAAEGMRAFLEKREPSWSTVTAEAE
jgi:enoyl-CoA hydratase/carnithine racemase